MRIVFCLTIVLLAFSSCKKNREKVIAKWRLIQYVEFDSLGDRTKGFSYSEICPFKIFEIEANTWSTYDENCDGEVIDGLNGIYKVEEDTMIKEGFDANGVWQQEWYLISWLSRRKYQFDLWKTVNDTTGEWEIVDARHYEYRKVKE